MDEQKRRDVEKKRIPPSLRMTRLFNSDVEDHVVELLNLDETPDAIAGCRKRLRREFE